MAVLVPMLTALFLLLCLTVGYVVGNLVAQRALLPPVVHNPELEAAYQEGVEARAEVMTADLMERVRRCAGDGVRSFSIVHGPIVSHPVRRRIRALMAEQGVKVKWAIDGAVEISF